MKRLIYIIALICLVGCEGSTTSQWEGYDDGYLNGPIIDYDSFPQTLSAKLTPLKIVDKHICAGRMAVCDSLMVFSHHKFEDSFIRVLNLNTGREVAALCAKGRSDNTYQEALIDQQFEKSGGDIKLWVHNRLKSLDLVNITESIKQGRTIFDRRIMTKEKELCHTFFGYFNIHSMGGDRYLANVLCHYENKDDVEYKPMHLEIYEGEGTQPLETYKLFQRGVVNPYYNHEDYIFVYYASRWTFSPDRKHYAWGMENVDVLGVVDLQSHQVRGAHRAGALQISDLTKKFTGELKLHYALLRCDNDYIYALHTGHNDPEKSAYGYSNRIYVFDWKANPIAQINLPIEINNMVLDTENDILYGMNEVEEEIYRINFQKLKK